MFNSIPKLNFKLMQYRLFILKVNGDSGYNKQFVPLLFDFHFQGQMHSQEYNAIWIHLWIHCPHNEDIQILKIFI